MPLNRNTGVRWHQCNHVGEVMTRLIKGSHSSAAKVILSHAAMCLADKRGVFSMSIGYGVDVLGYSRSQIRNGLKALQDLGAVELCNGSGRGGISTSTGKGIANRYRINFRMPGVTSDEWFDLVELCGPAIEEDRRKRADRECR